MVIAYGITLALFALYSYSLLDLNLTLLNFDLWTQFRNVMIQFGYFQRLNSTFVFVALICLVSGFHLYLLKNYKKYSALHLSLIIAVILLFAYPFLSHDLFNYPRLSFCARTPVHALGTQNLSLRANVSTHDTYTIASWSW